MVALLATGAPAAAQQEHAGDAPLTCTTLDAPDEPRCNPHLAQSPWATNHRNSYAQASTPLPGVTGTADTIDVAHTALTSVPVVLTFSEPYPDGERVIWASGVGVTGEVAKLDPETMAFIDHHIPQIEEPGTPPLSEISVSGAYSLLDRDNRFIVGRLDGIEVYGDAVPGDRRSSIAVRHRFVLPEEARCGDDDQLVALGMTYDGFVAFATERGIAGVVPRQPERMTAENLRTLKLHDRPCDGDDVEIVSNSLALDETGRIYIVTGDALYGVDWDGTTLQQGWRAEYRSADGVAPGRLGPGSGSTPSVMGTDADDDQLVVITDGQDLMHLVLMWRDEIPDGWEPIREGADPRIACEVPVTFGDPERTGSVSEQSVLVSGTSTFLVNDQQPLEPVLSPVVPDQLSLLTPLLHGTPGNEPRGIERIDWDPETRSCSKVWANADVSLPNGIPTLSTATGLIYTVGVRDGIWTLEGIDVETGAVELTAPTAPFPMQNSIYAATTIGPDGSVWSGTFGGITRWRPCTPERCERLGPLEALIGPLGVEDPGRHYLGLPNDEVQPDDGCPGPGTCADRAGSTSGEVDAQPTRVGRQADADGDEVEPGAPLPVTGGGLPFLGALLLAPLLARRTRR